MGWSEFSLLEGTGAVERFPGTAGDRPDEEHQEPSPQNLDTGEEARRSTTEHTFASTKLGLTIAGHLLFGPDTVEESFRQHTDDLMRALLQKCPREEAIAMIEAEHARLDSAHPLAEAILYVYHSLIFLQAGREMKSADYRTWYQVEAASLSGKALAMVPDSIPIAYHHVSALYMPGAKLDEVARLCEEALAVKNPNDLLWLAMDPLTEIQGPDSRIKYYRHRLISLLAQVRREQAAQRTAVALSELASAATSGVETTTRRCRAATYWLENMDPAMKESFFRIPVKHLNSFSEKYPLPDVKEALAFVQIHGSVRGVACSLCNGILPLTEGVSPLAHLELLHGEFRGIREDLSSDMLLQEVDQGYADVVRTELQYARDASVEVATQMKPLGLETLEVTQERNRIIKRIESILCFLIQRKSLYKSHLDKILIFTKQEVRAFYSGAESPVLTTCLRENPLWCMCILSTPQLHKVNSFLEKLFRLAKAPRKGPSRAKQAILRVPNVYFDHGSSCLVLDKSHFSSDAVECSSTDEPNADSLMLWLYPEREDEFLTHVLAWQNKRARIASIGSDALGKFKEYHSALYVARQRKLVCIKKLQEMKDVSQPENQVEVSTSLASDPWGDNCWTLHDYTSQDDAPTAKSAIVNQLLEADSSLMKYYYDILHCEKGLEEAHTLDFSAILRVILKTFMQEIMDALVEKDAAAAAAEVLIEFSNSSLDDTEHRPNKKKKKKKAKKSSKPKALDKDGNISGKTLSEVSSTSAGVNNVDNVPIHSDDNVRENVEKEMRQLQRNLDYQMKLEHEYKQSQLEKKGKGLSS